MSDKPVHSDPLHAQSIIDEGKRHEAEQLAIAAVAARHYVRLSDGSVAVHAALDARLEVATQVLELCVHLQEAADAYDDLLTKYGKAHGWGRIHVQSWREAIQATGIAVEGVVVADQDPQS